MKILLITSFFPPTHTAGTEKRTLGYAIRLLDLGYEVEVICAGTLDEGDKYWNGVRVENYRGVKVTRIDLNWALADDPNSFLYRNPIIAEKIKNWLPEINPDLVHITSCYSLSASVIETISEFNIPLVLTLTDFWFICPKHTLLRFDESLCDGRTSNWECVDCMLSGNKVYQKLRPLMINNMCKSGIEWISTKPSISNLRGFRGMALNVDDRKAYLQNMITKPDVVVAPSEYLKDVFTASGVNREIRVIQSGHDLSWLVSSNQRQETGKINFGFIGQIIPIKGLHLIINAFKKEPVLNQAQLLVFGSFERNSPYQNQINELIEHNVANISMRGSFPHDQLNEVLSEIDILIVPSVWHENNPRVIQEAFAAKTPVIVSNVGGMSEFVNHEGNGLLFERNDPVDLARQMARIVNEPNLIGDLQNGIKPVRTIREEVEALFSIYEELIL
jgi:glycosyltransferase involved in cell wall biosynthesis